MAKISWCERQSGRITLARLLKLPKVTNPLVRAGVWTTGPASGDGV